MLDMLEANRLTVAKDNRFSKIIGGTTIQVTSAGDGPEKLAIKVPTQLVYFETADGLSTFTVANPHSNMLGDFKRPMIHVVSFLQLLEFKPTAHDAQGISWLELFIIFELWGGMTVDTRPQTENMSTARMSLKSELAIFKSVSRSDFNFSFTINQKIYLSVF